MNEALYRDAVKTCFRSFEDSLRVTEDGILSFWPTHSIAQEDEQKMRDDEMRKVVAELPESEILKLVGRHHCLPVMQKKAAAFRASFSSNNWIVDIGGGTGAYWRGTRGAKILLVDFSYEMLRTAKVLLHERDDVLLVHADAARLPFMNHSIAGWWSVQVFQHFPFKQQKNVLIELRRVLRQEWHAEITNLNPSLLYRIIYKLCGKRFHLRGTTDTFELNLFTAKEWSNFFNQLLTVSEQSKIQGTYSELFFHPNFKIFPTPYPLAFEMWLTRVSPWVCSLFARQSQLNIMHRSK